MKSVLSSRLEKEKGKWTDASKDAVKFFAEVFEGDLGKDWKKKMFRWIPESQGPGYMPRRIRPAYHKLHDKVGKENMDSRKSF